MTFARKTYRPRLTPEKMTNEEIMDGYNDVFLTQGRMTVAQRQYVDDLVGALITSNRERDWDD